MINIIIPAAGVGTRLRPHTHSAPKALLQVAGKPILGHILDRLTKLEQRGTISLVVGFLAEQIENYVRSNHPELDVRFVYQSDLRGLGYAIHLALEDIPGNGPVLVILGDTIVDIDLAAFMEDGHDSLGVKEVEDPRRFGVVEVENGLIRRLVEKPADPPSNLAVVGLYGINSTALLRECLREVVTRDQRARGELQMTDALQLMVERGSRMHARTVDGWYDCGKLETLLLTNRHLLEQMQKVYQLPDSVVINPSYVAPSAKVERCIIGPYVSIGDRAEVSESILVNTIVSNDAEVRRCVLEDSMIGSNAAVSGHVQRLNVGDSSEIGIFD
ncbi:MAG: sugar phosphate nucleotidyltransferase [Candidatus Zixiibacteriota bacterium]